jgi:hypothetical protein
VIGKSSKLLKWQPVKLESLDWSDAPPLDDAVNQALGCNSCGHGNNLKDEGGIMKEETSSFFHQ